MKYLLKQDGSVIDSWSDKNAVREYDGLIQSAVKNKSWQINAAKGLNFLGKAAVAWDIGTTVYHNIVGLQNKENVENLYKYDIENNISNIDKYYEVLISQMTGRNTVDEGWKGWLTGTTFKSNSALLDLIDFDRWRSRLL